MSILNENPTSRTTEVQRKASRVKFLTKALADEILRSWNEGWDLIWEDENPQEILDILGEDAGEIFDLNEHTILFLSNILGGRRQSQLDGVVSKLGSKPETQTDENGNVTII